MRRGTPKSTLGNTGALDIVKRPTEARRRVYTPSTRAGATASATTTWEDVRQVAGRDALKGYYLTGSKPASSPTKPLPPSPNPQSSQPVVLFRDTNGWCPYCQKVWMALLEKDIPFDSVLINLQSKPEWYSQVLESKLTPAARINGEIVGESLDIMLELEKQFADSPALLPADKEDEIRAFIKTWEAVSRSTVSLTFAASPPTEEQEPLVEALAKFLDDLEEQVKAHGGPHLFGAISLADVTVAPFMPGLANAEIAEINLTRHPHVAEAMRALRERPSYQATAVDFHTRKTILKAFFGSGAPQKEDMSHVPAAEMEARQEAAAKIARNRTAVIKRMLTHTGVVRRQGSEYGETVTNVNGYSMNPHEGEVRTQVEAALLRVCSSLLTDNLGASPVNKEAVAIQVATLAYFRNLGASPRDMSAPAIEQLRAACDRVISAAYEFPEKPLR